MYFSKSSLVAVLGLLVCLMSPTTLLAAAPLPPDGEDENPVPAPSKSKAEPEKSYRYRAIVTGVDPAAKTFRFKMRDYERIVQVTDKTAITARGAKARFSALAVGAEVAGDSVPTGVHTHRALSVSIERPAPSASGEEVAITSGFRGKVTAIDLDEKTIKILTGKSKTWTLKVTPESKFENDGASTDLTTFAKVALGKIVRGKTLRADIHDHKILEIRITSEQDDITPASSTPEKPGEED